MTISRVLSCLSFLSHLLLRNHPARLTGLALLVVFGRAPLSAAEPVRGDFVATTPSAAPGRILVQMQAGADSRQLEDAVDFYGGRSREYLPAIHTHVVELPPGAEQAVVQELLDEPGVALAERDMQVSLTFIPDDTKYGSAWHLQTMNLPQAWDGSMGDGITVAVLDTGILASHEDFQGKLVSGWNAVDQGNDYSDLNGHGTKVAGVIGALTNNGMGVASIAPNARIMPIRVSNASDGVAYFSDIARGLTWAADHGARVANISYDVSSSSIIANAAQYMRSKGGVVVVAAGNSGSEQFYADSPYMISVSATRKDDALASWSSYGNYVDVSAPGVSLWTTAKGGGYATASGTSFASPATAAVAALVLAADSSLTPDEVEQILEETARELGSAGWDKRYGHGRVDAAAAVARARQGQGGDAQAPSVAISSPVANASVSGTLTVTVTASDNVGVQRVELYVGSSLLGTDLTAPYQFSWNTSVSGAGSRTLTAYAYDAAGNSSSAAVNVTVADTTPPVVVAPADRVVEASGPLTAVSLGSASASDDVDGSLSATPSSSGPFTVGTHQIVWSATDSAGNTGTATQTLTVRDTTPPQVTAPADLTVQASGSSTSVNLGNASAVDLVDGSLSAAPSSSGPFTVGTHQIVWSATDSAGNTGTAVQTLVVSFSDLTPPRVTAPPDILVEASGPLTAVSLGSASASDDVDGSLSATPSSSGPFTVGTHQVVWSATDSAGNRGTAIQQVRVQDTTAPSLVPPPDIRVGASGHLTEVELGTPSVSDAVSRQLQAVVDDRGPFTSGRHLVTWTATDAAGNRSTATQVVIVEPRVDVAVDQVLSEGSRATVTVHLSGEAASYPVRVPYRLSGTALNPADHDAVDGVIRIDSGTSGSFGFDIVDDGFGGEGDETLLVTLGTPVNAVPGSRLQHRITITENNVRPRAMLKARQAGLAVRRVYRDQGPVTVSATVIDPNPGDSHRYDWSLSDNSLVSTQAMDSQRFVFDPAQLTPGLYRISLKVSDDGTPSASVVTELLLQVEAEAPQLSPLIDSDADGQPDADEGSGDSDEDGIPDYLDALDSRNLLQGEVGDVERGLLHAEAGLNMRLGGTALAAGRNAGRIRLDDVIRHGGRNGEAPGNAEETLSYPGGIFDFEIDGLSEQGQSVRVVLPQQVPVPAGAVYRKYHPEQGWSDFVIDSRNRVASAPGGVDGSCPAPGSGEYVDGLTPGHLCVQLTLEDGGPNDADGRANGTIQDPGGVAAPAASDSGDDTLGVAVSAGGGGGCVLGSRAEADGSWWLILLLLAALRLPRREGWKLGAGS
ncbi:S8 family serine peptidase [Thiohalobacter sp. IOR34]|uniref:S8 family serine peptidase n=1 Tax=Thiohalobacter sp. IOR34 TaxID=3057176 RepID=UPI0025B17142|nr:S8 family serine peptidase [Thiohalobacter sp. IOR34]WJW75118.1 S8 family serine peptidase [Thiohalobacter sp. IOR34]